MMANMELPDILVRLNNEADTLRDRGTLSTDDELADLFGEAAEEIERLHKETTRLRHLLKSSDELIEDLERGVEVLDAIPGCPIHGQGCAPWALEWIAKMRYATIPIPFECPCHIEAQKITKEKQP